MSMPVFLVGIGAGYCREDLNVRALDVMRTADRVYYLGERLGPELVQLLGSRWVRHALDGQSVVEDVLASHLDAQSVAVLFSGDGLAFSGEPGVFPSEGAWRQVLAERGVPFEAVPGTPMAVLAARAAGWSVEMASGFGFAMSSPLRGSSAPLVELEAVARSPAALALLQSVHGLGLIVETMRRYRGPTTAIATAFSIGWPDQAIRRSTLGADDCVESLMCDEPAVVLVGPDVRATLPATLRHVAASWLARHASERLSWIAGPPGIGKTTFLRALSQFQEALVIRELADVGRPILATSGTTPGGMTAKRALVEALRAVATRGDDHWVVSVSDPPDRLLGPLHAGESISVLVSSEELWEARLMGRPPREELVAPLHAARGLYREIDEWSSSPGVDRVEWPHVTALVGQRSDT